ncbi:DUF4236 domain-containing protein [Proteiniclasticum sp.]|uniref:DUF4236 domain-containing protein n=1 Tax=Proteiniclasticum sp. TaxID=2053595 RepID=UPI0028963C1E|nr:DUF4236 domain-containing protein [Proteiniclasticum sp.]
MGFNFRKRIRLGKLFNLNIGKSGASISFGGKGFRQSISTRGNARTTFSIPGTGLSYSKTVSAKKLLKKGANRSVFDTSKASADPEAEVSEYENDIALITTLHHFEDYPSGIDWNEVKNEDAPFAIGETGPNTEEALSLIDKNKPGLFKRIIAKSAFKEESEKILEEARKMDDELYKAWENNKQIADRILTNDRESYLEALEDIKISEELGYYIRSMDFSYTDDDSLNVELSLSIDDFIPVEYKTLTPTGRLSVKKYTKTDYYEIANQFVSGLVLRLSRNLFNLLPIEDVLVNVWESEENKYSHVEEKRRILSILVDREAFEKIRMEEVNPFDALEYFRHEVRFVRTRGFNEVGELSK